MRKEVNGVPLYYKLYPQAGAGRPWLVLIHALGMYSESWREQVGPLGAVYNLITYDVRGSGRSSWLPLNDSPADTGSGGGQLSFDLLASDLRGLLEVTGHPDAGLIGWAMGGMVAIAYAASYQPPALILADSAAAYPAESNTVLNKRADEILAGGDRWLAATEAQVNRWISTAGQQRKPRLAQTALDSLQGFDPPALAALMRVTGGVQLADRLPRIGCPTLVLVGDEDVAAPPALAQQLVAGIAGAEFATIKQAGHLSPLEQPAQFNRLVLDFLARKLGLEGRTCCVPYLKHYG